MTTMDAATREETARLLGLLDRSDELHRFLLPAASPADPRAPNSPERRLAELVEEIGVEAAAWHVVAGLVEDTRRQLLHMHADLLIGCIVEDLETDTKREIAAVSETLEEPVVVTVDCSRIELKALVNPGGAFALLAPDGSDFFDWLAERDKLETEKRRAERAAA